MPPGHPADALPPAGAGRRVVLRHRLPDGSATDLVGVLVADGPVLAVRRDDGELVLVGRDDVLAARPVPPRTQRRSRQGGAGDAAGEPGPPVVGVLDLEATLARVWLPGEVARSGRWLLRSARDLTRRASSVLVLGRPGPELLPQERGGDDLVTAVERAAAWQRAHGSTPRFQLPHAAGVPVGAAARADAAGLAVAADVDHLLAQQGWPQVSRTTVLVGRTGDLAGGPAPAGVTVGLADAPSRAWSGVVRPDEDDPVVEALLRSAPEQVFVTLAADGAGPAAVAAGRMALADGWAVVTDVAVRPEHRRQGLGRAVLHALAGWAIPRQETPAGPPPRVALQVADRNDAARALYDSLGLVEHHRYAYREHPGG
ncbi:GNAT family N-acetyltransferase [Pseudokineococcus sp. 1T1Z-3]|uniref:GNAT family N-acetyltransferase n=1 Tax=Pseudokineococcus sp. 1T1Z-3 TaxID=3132745 RepID=UPI0030A028A0